MVPNTCILYCSGSGSLLDQGVKTRNIYCKITVYQWFEIKINKYANLYDTPGCALLQYKINIKVKIIYLVIGEAILKFLKKFSIKSKYKLKKIVISIVKIINII